MPRYLVSMVGQSNERGSGPSGSKSRVGGVGAPMVDANQRSWWPSCVESAGRRGVWLDVANTAIGTTALTDSWVGRCRSWVTSMIVTRGTYVLSGGGLWRCNLAASTVAASTVAPTGTSDTTGADSVPWVYVGAPAVGDTDGTVYAYGSARFDPCGYIAAAIAALDGKPGYDGKGVYVSIGQGDHTVSATRSQYANAMQRVAERVTSLGYRCYLGATCYMAGDAARETTFQTVLLPGRLDALAALAGDPLVFAGADLRTALGVLTAGVADTAIGLQSDELHLTSAGYDAAGPIVDAALAAASW